MNRVNVAPRVAIDQAVLEASIAALAAKVDRDPVPAIVTAGTNDFIDTPALWGRDVDQAAMIAAISEALASPDAPAALTIPLEVAPVAPAVTDVDAMIARSRANRMTAPVVLTHDRDKWTIPAATVRGWISFGTWPDGSYGPLADTAKIEAAVQGLSKKIDQKAVSASFYTGKSGAVVGVKAGRTGRKLDVPGTISRGPGAPRRARRDGHRSRRAGRAGPGHHPAGADHRGGREGRSPDEGDLDVDDLLPVECS